MIIDTKKTVKTMSYQQILAELAKCPKGNVYMQKPVKKKSGVHSQNKFSTTHNDSDLRGDA